MRSFGPELAAILTVAVLLAGLADAGEGVKPLGFFLHTGTGSGSGPGLALNCGQRHQFRTMAGVTQSNGTFDAFLVHERRTLPVEVRVSGLAATLEYRYYPFRHFYLATGIVHTRQNARFDVEDDSLGLKETVKGEVRLLSVPALIGAEWGRTRYVSLYAEGGLQANLNNHKPGTLFHGESLSPYFWNEAYEYRWGAGLSFNFGEAWD
ncbi:MAG: hypothetical protein JWP91_3305 [Fibrobacteres bacterium]|nr:hypothetical protein [Fibrobacterota bacterium]